MEEADKEIQVHMVDLQEEDFIQKDCKMLITQGSPDLLFEMVD